MRFGESWATTGSLIELHRIIFPDYHIRVPQKDIKTYIDIPVGYFLEEREGIDKLFADMTGVGEDIAGYLKASGKAHITRKTWLIICG